MICVEVVGHSGWWWTFGRSFNGSGREGQLIVLLREPDKSRPALQSGEDVYKSLAGATAWAITRMRV